MDTGQWAVSYDQSSLRFNIVHYNNIAISLISHLPLSKVINLTETTKWTLIYNIYWLQLPAGPRILLLILLSVKPVWLLKYFFERSFLGFMFQGASFSSDPHFPYRAAWTHLIFPLLLPI
jgi:hypothetical protein